MEGGGKMQVNIGYSDFASSTLSSVSANIYEKTQLSITADTKQVPGADGSMTDVKGYTLKMVNTETDVVLTEGFIETEGLLSLIKLLTTAHKQSINNTSTSCGNC